MKIYVLLMLIGIIVGFSYLPIRRPAGMGTLLSPDSVPARAYQLSGKAASAAG
jgi:hypothetical protein